MKTATLFICYSALVLGYDGTCSTESCAAPDDEVQLMQTHAKLHKHKHSKADVLASFEKKAGPVALQELKQALMNLPSFKSKEAMLAAVHTQPQLQHLAKRYSRDLKTLGIFDDVESIHELKAAMFKVRHSSMAREKGTSFMKFKKDIEEPAAYLVWLESWGCDAAIAYTDFPKSMDHGSAPLFSPDCQGWPWVDNYAISPEEEGAYFVFGNWSDVTYETSYHAGFVGEEGVKVLGSLGSNVHSTAFGGEALHFISRQGDWPNETFHLMSATAEGGATEALAMTDCLYPWGLKNVPGSNTMLWQCSKDWNMENDTNKIMQWSGDGAPTVLVATEDYFGHVVVTSSKLFYSMYKERDDGTWGNHLYSCSLADCQPEEKGPVPNDAWHFVVSEFGELITTSYVSWQKTTSEGTDYWTEYDVHDNTLDALGADSPALFTISGDQRLQLLDFRQGPKDLTEDHPELPEDPDDGSGFGEGSGTKDD